MKRFFPLLFVLALLGQVSALFAETDLIAGQPWSFYANEPAAATFADNVAFPDQPGGFATGFRAEITAAAPAAPWSSAMVLTIPGALSQGQSLQLRFWARSATSTPIGVIAQRNGPPYDGTLGTDVTLTPTWKEYVFDFTSVQADPGGWMLSLRLALATGTVEITGVRLLETTYVPPPVGSDLIAGSSWTFYNNASAVGTREAVTFSDSPGGFSSGQRIVMTATGTDPWSAALTMPIPARFVDGQILRLHYWARSTTASSAYVLVEREGGDFAKSLYLLQPFTSQWTEYAYTFVTKSATANTWALRFQTGKTTGTIELAGIRLETWGTHPNPVPPSINFDPYGGQPVNTNWKPLAKAGIELFRKGTLLVNVLDHAGHPVTNAKVTVEQQKHAFHWGTAVDHTFLLGAGPDAERYRTEVKRLFNALVPENALKWDFMSRDPVSGPAVVQWALDNHLPIRGHNVWWPYTWFLPPNVQALSGQPYRDAVERRTREVVASTKGKVTDWDVVNEAVDANAIEQGGRDLLWKTYVWAHETDPNIGLVYNDYSISDNRAGLNTAHFNAVKSVVQELKANGAPVTAVGDQSHIAMPLTPVNKVVQLWTDLITSTGLPLKITEFDVNLGGIQDEGVQARYTEDFMTAAFGNPKITDFILWGFWDGAHWLGDKGAGMFRKDWSRRPVLDTYERLLFKDWWTRASGKTLGGVFVTRAFYGTHKITVEKEGQRAELTVDLPPGDCLLKTVELRLP